MKKKYSECCDQITGQRLEPFDDPWLARIEQTRKWFFNSIALTTFHCKACSKYHLAPEATISKPTQFLCSNCKSKKGGNKISYGSSLSAIEASNKLTVNNGTGTRVYPCPYGNGWHVTKEINNDAYRSVQKIKELMHQSNRQKKIKVTIGTSLTKNNKRLIHVNNLSQSTSVTNTLHLSATDVLSHKLDNLIDTSNLPLSSIDVLRIKKLVATSKTLKVTKKPMSKEDLMAWANTKNPLEYFFLANYLSVPHEAPNFSDPTLSARLCSWIDWAKKSEN